MTVRDARDLAGALVAGHPETFAEEAGVRVRDGPEALYELLLLSTLLACRMRAETGVRAFRALVAAGLADAAAMAGTDADTVRDVLSEAGYTRWAWRAGDELVECARSVEDEWGADLGCLRGRGRDEVEGELLGLPRMGPAGVAFFCREVQAVWPGIRPFFDAKPLRGAALLGLPVDAGELARLVPGEQQARLASALTRHARLPLGAGGR